MDDEPEKPYPLSPAKMSKTPSWVMVGFLLGAAFVWGYKRDAEKTAPVAPAIPAEWPKALTLAPSPLTTIEAVFDEWKEHAVWENNLTEVALWRSDTGAYSECYEVRRVNGTLYFRSIPRLTRRIVRSGTPLPTNTPLQFTESEAHYLAWLEQGRKKSLGETLVPPRPSGLTPRPTSLPPPVIDPSVPPLGHPRPEPLRKP